MALLLKHELLKWVANDLCESITKLFNLVTTKGFSASWIINIIQMIFNYGERRSPRNYRTIMLGIIFDKLSGSVDDEIISDGHN